MTTLIASLCCFGMWGVLAFGIAAGAHVRVGSLRRREAHGRLPSEGADEQSLLWYAASSAVWLAALGCAVALLLKRGRARQGLVCTYIFLGHITFFVLAVVVLMPILGPDGDLPLGGMVSIACAAVLLGNVAASALVARWAWRRTRRIEALPPTDATAPGFERWFCYAASLISFIPAALFAIWLSKPENVRVGRNCIWLGLANLVGFVALVCALIVWITTLA